MQINVLLADDHVIVTNALKFLINKALPEAKITAVKDFDAVMSFLRQTQTQLIVCDIDMPGANHFSIVKKIKSLQPDTKLLLLTAYDARLYAGRYLEEGADAYMNKAVEISFFEEKVLNLLGGETKKFIMPEKERARDYSQKAFSQLNRLSNRELEIAQLLVNGQGIIQIAYLLEVEASTVSTYKMRIFEKLKVKSVSGLVALFHNFAHLYPDNN